MSHSESYGGRRFLSLAVVDGKLNAAN